MLVLGGYTDPVRTVIGLFSACCCCNVQYIEMVISLRIFFFLGSARFALCDLKKPFPVSKLLLVNFITELIWMEQLNLAFGER